MSGDNSSRNHHWWPVSLQSYWADSAGDVSWINPNGEVSTKKAANRKIGRKIHGHTALRGSGWEVNFEKEFDIDNEIHSIIQSLRFISPMGNTVPEFIVMMKLLFKRDRTLRDMSKFYHLEERVHRHILLLIYSLLIRSPANRFRYESYPNTFGLPPNEDVGKINMLQGYKVAKDLCVNASICNQYFVILHSLSKRFLFGDGVLDWLSAGHINGRISGRALVPLTPDICVYFCTPMVMQNSVNCASLSVAPWIVDRVNEITQIYSKDKLFFFGRPPKLTGAFQQGQFLQHERKTDALIEMLDEIAGIESQKNVIAFSARSGGLS